MKFTEKEIEQLHHEHLNHPHPRVRQRCEVVYLKALKFSHQEIGRITRLSQPTMRSYLELYQADGLEKLKELNFYRPVSQLEAYRETLKAEFDARPSATINEAVERIENLTHIRRSPTQARKFLKDLGLKRLKVGQVPAKANPGKQKAFLEEELQPRLEEAKQGKRHLFFLDAAHFVMQPFLGFLWCFVRQFIQAPSGRQRFNVLGALHATTLQIVTFTNDSYINSLSVAKLMCQIAVQFAGLPITLVMDNARYQHCRFIVDLATALSIELLFLPTYSPNLNLIERLWRFVKKKCLYSKYYPTFTDFQQEIVDCIAKADGEHKQELASLLTLKFQTFENVNL